MKPVDNRRREEDLEDKEQGSFLKKQCWRAVEDTRHRKRRVHQQ